MPDDFTLAIGNFTQQTVKGFDLIKKKTAIDLFSSVVKDTPVDEGGLIGGWQITLGNPANSDTDRKDSNRTTVASEIASVGNQFSGDGSIHFSNLKPYVEVVEDGLYPTGGSGNEGAKVTSEGYSKKAPAGMVKRNVERFQEFFKEASSGVQT